MYAFQKGIEIPKSTDDLYPMMALKVFSGSEFGLAGILVGVTFLVGITAATYASSDSALTALTTAFSIDFMDVEKKEEAQRMRIKNRVHIAFSIIFVIVILIFNKINSTDVISAVYQIASYTYGPLLGLFAYGIYSKKSVIDKCVPFICIAAPILTYFTVVLVENNFGYKFGFENLLLNGLYTILGLMIFRGKK